MGLLGMVWANLFRKKTRTILTLLSVVVAFLLFLLLQAISQAFSSGGVNLVGVDRLVTSPKYSIVDNLPISQKQQIRAIDGVAAVTQQHWFGGQYQDPKNFFPKYPIEPREFFAMYDEFVIEPAVLDRFARTRTGAVAEASLAERYGWTVGDIIPIQADIWPKDDGTRLWEFELVGTFSGEDAPPLFLFQYQYFTEAVEDYGKDQVGWWSVKLSDPDRAQSIATAIDQLFENSLNPTRTATEDEFSRQFANQLGDIGFIASIIMSAVFFTILLLTANTMTQALRERVPELAVLKTLGFTDTTVSLLVLAESVLLCLAGGVLGIALAFLAVAVIGPALQGFLGSFDITLSAVAMALGLAVLLGLIIGSVPAWTAKRLSIIDALRAR